MRRTLTKPSIAIPLGVALNVAGFPWYEGPGRAESLSQYIAQAGNLARRDAMLSLVSSIPGYLLFFCGVAVLLRRRGQSSRLVRGLSLTIMVVAAAAAVLDSLKAAVVLVVAGTQDLDAPEFVMSAPQWLTDAWYPFFIRGLNAFVLNVGLCLIGLIVIAVQDARPRFEDSAASRMHRIMPAAAIPLGVVLYIIGLLGWSFENGRPSGLEEYAAQVGDLLRRDAVITVLFSVPGYLLLFCGVAILLRRRSRSAPLVGFVSRAIIVAATVTAVADVLASAIALVAASGQDLDSPGFAFTTPGWLTDAWQPLFALGGTGQLVCLGLCLLGLIVNAVQEPASADETSRRPLLNSYT